AMGHHVREFAPQQLRRLVGIPRVGRRPAFGGGVGAVVALVEKELTMQHVGRRIMAEEPIFAKMPPRVTMWTHQNVEPPTPQSARAGAMIAVDRPLQVGQVAIKDLREQPPAALLLHDPAEVLDRLDILAVQALVVIDHRAPASWIAKHAYVALP